MLYSANSNLPDNIYINVKLYLFEMDSKIFFVIY